LTGYAIFRSGRGGHTRSREKRDRDVMAHDVAVIRPEMRVENIRPRGRDFSPKRKHAVRKGLQTLHALEIMAVNIYKCQITSRLCALNTDLTAAMCNEMTHMQDFQTKLYEHGLKPSKLRWTFWLVGYALGLGSRMCGSRCMLRTGAWAERKAVHDYGELLAGIEWDEDTRAVIEKDQADESGHIERWEYLLAHPDAVC
jgi:demethoxyubiquinone hydroxylase (CLK1/Coq7/Cat5 family)